MEESEIKKLLQVQRGAVGHRGWRCPEEIQLAAYVAQRSGSNSIEAHVADCDFCLSQVAFLAQSADWVNSVDVPANLLATVRNQLALKPSRGINWGWRWVATAAAVACFAFLILAIGLRLRTPEEVLRPDNTHVAQQITPATSPETMLPPSVRPELGRQVPAPKGSPAQAPAVRGNTAAELRPRLMIPRDGEVLRRDNLEFRWEPVTDAVFYDVRVMSTAGDLVFEGQTESTSLKPDSSVQLAPGTKYFVVTRAHLPQGKTAKSSIVSFRLAAQ